jgi:hypothetical protein
MPAQAGIQELQTEASGEGTWIPAFAGMTYYLFIWQKITLQIISIIREKRTTETKKGAAYCAPTDY